MTSGMSPFITASLLMLVFGLIASDAAIVACRTGCCVPSPPIFLVRLPRTASVPEDFFDDSIFRGHSFGSPEQNVNQYGSAAQTYSNQGYGFPQQQSYQSGQIGGGNAYGNVDIAPQNSYGVGYQQGSQNQPQTTYYSTDSNQLGTQGAMGGFASAVSTERGYPTQQQNGNGYAEQSVGVSGQQTMDNTNLDNYAQYIDILQKQYGIKVPGGVPTGPVGGAVPSAPATNNVYAAAVQQSAQIQQQPQPQPQQMLSSAVQGGTYTVSAGSPSPNVALPQGHHVGTAGFNPWQTGYMSNYQQQLAGSQNVPAVQPAPAPAPAPVQSNFETYQSRSLPQQPRVQTQSHSYETYVPQPQVQPQPQPQPQQLPQAPQPSYETYPSQQPQPQTSYQSSISTYGNDYSTETQVVAQPPSQPRGQPQVVPYQPQPLPPSGMPTYPIQPQQLPYQPSPQVVQPHQPQPAYPNPQPLPVAPIQPDPVVHRPAPEPLPTVPTPVYTLPPPTEPPTTVTPPTTTALSNSLSSATSVQALTQQIRRLPAVLYVDSRNPESRRTENMLRETYGLPLVAFYVDKIDKPKIVERHLQQLTAHKGLPYLFICGTFIGSQQHIDNYHNNKQVPQLIEYVCGDEKKRKAKSAVARS